MTTNEFTGTAPPISEQELREVEKELGYKLPPDLRRHYLRYNGGQPTRRYFINRQGIDLEIDTFRPIKHRSYPRELTLERSVAELVRKKKLIPESLVPFAVNSGGDYYCIDRGDQSIVYYTMDDYLEPEKAMTRIASSLAEFIEGMVTEQELK